VILVLRHALRTMADLATFGVRSGHLWLPFLIIVLAVATLAIVAIKTVVPVAAYVLF